MVIRVACCGREVFWNWWPVKTVGSIQAIVFR